MKLTVLTGFVLLAFGAVGCECLNKSHKPVPSPPVTAVVPAPVAEVRGAVLAAGSVPIPPTGLTLADAIRQAGGVTPVDDTRDAGVLVSLQKGGTNYYFSAAVIREGAAGQIFLSPGDRVSVVPWTTTDLFRGLKSAPPATAIGPDIQPPALPDEPKEVIRVLLAWSKKVFPKKEVNAATEGAILQEDLVEGASQLQGVFLSKNRPDLPDPPSTIKTWANKYIASALSQVPPRDAYVPDWDALSAMHPESTRTRIVTINYRLFSERGEERVSDESKKIFFPRANAGPNAAGLKPLIKLPFIKSPTSLDVSTQPHPRVASAATRSQTLGVMVVRRLVNGVPTEFVLSRSGEAGAQQLMRYVLIQNGDELEITDPARLPVVTASLLAPLLQPNGVSAAERERSMGFLKECLRDKVSGAGAPLKLPARR